MVNKILKKLVLRKKYNRIRDGIKFVFLKWKIVENYGLLKWEYKNVRVFFSDSLLLRVLIRSFFFKYKIKLNFKRILYN